MATLPDGVLREAAKKYYDTLMANFTAKEKADAVAEGSGKYVAVVNNYGTLSKTRMKKADDAARAILDKYLTGSNALKTKILAPDHTDPVAEIRFSNALQEASLSVARKEAIMAGNDPNAVPTSRISDIANQTLEDLGRIEINSKVPIETTVRERAIMMYTAVSSRFTSGLTSKKFDLTVGFEVAPRSFEDNRIGGDEVKNFTNKLAKAAAEVAGKTNWAAQESSDSFMTAMQKGLNNIAVKAGASGRKQTINAAPATARAEVRRKIKEKLKEVKPQAQVSSGARKSAQSPTPTISLSAITNYLNARITPAVMRNMGPGSLINRTGTFANSVRIVSTTRTAQGYPSIGYTYQRSPYDVFDPTLGKSPWNIPGRDPNEIIKKSVREIASELAIGRFYLRRA